MNKFIVFVHGLGGKKDKTWGNFPQYIIDDPDIDHQVIEYGYTSPNFFTQFFKSGPTILNIANGLLTEIKTRCDLKNDEIILVGHSMGGLVIKRLLVRLSKLETKHNIKKVCFFDVPHGGSGLANIGKFIAFNNRHLKSLVNNSSDLDALDEDWVDKKLSDQLNILSIIDANETIVSSVSSKSLFRHHPIETINGVNHSSIVKPNSKDDTQVILLKSFINNSPSVGKLNLDTAKPIKEWLKYDERKHELSYEEDKPRKMAFSALSVAIDSDACSIRLTGLSGLGKSRLLLEYKNRNNINDDNFLIFNGSENINRVENSIKIVAESGVVGFIIIDNCSVELHNYATNAIEVNNSPIKLITTYFYHEDSKKLKNSIRIKLEKLGAEQITKIIESRLPDLDSSSKKQLEIFIEGFPLLAQMTIKELQQEGRVTTNFDESNLVEKLINGDGSLSEQARELLKVFSLFDYFRFQKGIRNDINEDAEFLKRVAGASQITFENTITTFYHKELINCTGSLARVVPKPLALNLAMEWWNTSAFDRQSEIVSSLPATLLDSFCDQIRYLDSSINVQSFVENFCAANSPFGQAELLLSKQGSRLFRALVEVNPSVTNSQLHRVISNLADKDILDIKGDVRRNFVWALEMLVFHKHCFNKSSWILFKFAQFENETYSNNSLGQFSQLFRWKLPGTEADFNQRLKVLNKALSLNLESADVVIIDAIKTALDTHGGTRTIRAEFQGTKPELKEWHPQKYQEIYDYWQSLLKILLVIIKRGYLIEEIKDAFGHEIRGLIRYNLPDKLDYFIKEVIKLTGKYWPAAVQSISYALSYDTKEMNQKKIDILMSWNKLLTPDENSIEEILKLVVLNPPRDFKKDDSGHYIDEAAEAAKDLAKVFVTKLTDLYEYIDLLMTFHEQKQSWLFAKHLAIEADSTDELLHKTLEYLRNHKNVNTQFFTGFFSGVYIKEPAKWKEIIDLFGSDENLIKYYPDAIRTGQFDISNLDTFIRLISEDKLPSHAPSILAYGSATEHLTEKQISNFCMSLSKIDENAKWVALDNMYMYIFARDNLDFSQLRRTLIHLVLNVSFKKEDKCRYSDSFHWLNSVKRLLHSENAEFALQLCSYIIDQVVGRNIDYSDLWDYLNNAFYKACELHGNYIWPKISNRFTDEGEKKSYYLIDLLGSGRAYKKRDSCVFDILKPEEVVAWCKDDVALLIVTRAISIFILDGEQRIVNPLLIQLLTEYYYNESFLSEIYINFSSRSWSGSLVPYLEADKKIIENLTEHYDFNVRNWAVSFIETIDHQIKYQENSDAENNILRGW
ncbi:esterase/lipase family protein [Rosenbergiella australiborealis]|uniref:esterase/lipase family protein n=1 Tax=Rosenbergiella australiborealis TaxID=1544696 RepID=UPI001F4E74BC|nr:hypothetical protein [Rosenbergiella australiborealis]